MNANEQRAVLNIMIHAALADGRKSEDERVAIRDAAESLVTAGGGTLAGVYQDVLLKRVTLESAAAALPALEHRQLAYEMAVCVIDADGVQSEGEQAFLASLRQRLGLEADETAGPPHREPIPSSLPLTRRQPTRPPRRWARRAPLRPSMRRRCPRPEPRLSSIRLQTPLSISASSTTRSSMEPSSFCRSLGRRWRSSRCKSEWFTASDNPMGSISIKTIS